MKDILVPMTPDHTVVWRQQHVEGGSVLVRPDNEAAEAAAHLIVNYATGNAVSSDWQICNEGTEGMVYRAEDLAVKAFKYPTHNANLNALRANVTFETAIARYDHPVQTSAFRKLFGRACQHPDLTFTTPTMHAAFLPEENSGLLPVWAMSYEHGQVPRTVDRTAAVRHRHYQNALASCGANPSQVSFDDRKSNMLARPNSQGGWEIVKFDVRPSVEPIIS